MTHPSDREVGGKKMSFVNKPKGLRVKGCRPAHPPGPPSLWKTVIINYSGAHGALFERAWSLMWRGGTGTWRGKAGMLQLCQSSGKNWWAGKRRGSMKAFYAVCFGQTHGSLSISVKVMLRLESHLYNCKYLLSWNFPECTAFNKFHGKYSFLIVFS